MKTYVDLDGKQTECTFQRIKPQPPIAAPGPQGTVQWQQTIDSRADAQLTFPNAVDFLTPEQQIALVVDSLNYEAVVLRVAGGIVLCKAWSRIGLSVREAQQINFIGRK